MAENARHVGANPGEKPESVAGRGRQDSAGLPRSEDQQGLGGRTPVDQPQPAAQPGATADGMPKMVFRSNTNAMLPAVSQQFLPENNGFARMIAGALKAGATFPQRGLGRK
jgi:hypothetical protein